MTHEIAFLHTAKSHIKTFGDLMDAQAPQLSVRHDVQEDLLKQAMYNQGCIDDDLQRRIEQAIANCANTGAKIIVCSCSTIAAAAQKTQCDQYQVIRIDQAMADEAVKIGSSILILATLESTIDASYQLVKAQATQLKKNLLIETLVIDSAWGHFEQQKLAEYDQCIIEALVKVDTHYDVIILAQASMQNAYKKAPRLKTKVLSSPQLGVNALIKSYQALGLS